MAGDERVDLDLIPTELIVPRLRKVAIGALMVGVLVAVITSFFLPTTVAVVLGVVVGIPAAASAWVGIRRRTWLDGNIV
ncbi:MAG: hypothetical protein ABW188_01010, partial [Rhodococcus fascians]